jgi:UDP-N-acetylmuramate dehydrogenase
MNELIDLVKEREIGKTLENVSMKKYTTYRVGGNARLMIYPKNVDKLIELIRMCKFRNIKFKVLGNGSNTLFSDKDYDGVIIKLDEFNELSMIGARTIRVGAGYSLMKLVQFAVKKNLAGLEFAGGIPGTVGGAIYMNAGAYKSDMGFVVKRIKVLTPDYHVITLTNNELNFHYRTSFLQTHPGYICLEAIIGLKKGKRAELEKVLEERKKRRVESQPLEYPSAGSVFRNPEDNFAGKMIEDVGLKGLERGGAQISDKHANFIINKNNATANDIMTLINLVRDTIKENYGVELKVEQEFVNWE